MDAEKDKPIEIGKYVLTTFILLIVLVGLIGFTSPAPSKWDWPLDCEWKTGKVIHKGVEEIACIGEVCYKEYYFKVQYDNSPTPSTIWVSPKVYLSHNVGDLYTAPIC